MYERHGVHYDILEFTGPSGAYEGLTVLVELADGSPGVSRKRLVRLADDLAETHGVQHIGFTDRREYLGSGYPLGFWKQDDARGDASRIREKQWDFRPTAEDARLWREWSNSSAEEPDTEEERIAVERVSWWLIAD